MKHISCLIFAVCFFVRAAAAPLPVTLTITNSPGFAIPADYAGLSFGAIAELADHGGVSGHLFSPTNAQLITLFQNSGIRNLRLGGTTVEGIHAAVPDRAAIDDVFGFARATGLKVIYSLRLLNGSSATDALTAQYIWQRYRPLLVCFAIGNEPDVKRYRYPPFGTGTDPAITNYASYLADWRRFASAIRRAAPGVTFAGPDAAKREWAQLFARDEKNSGMVTLITQHFYIGGRPYLRGTTETIPAPKAIDAMLSKRWVRVKYPRLDQHTLAPVVADGLPYRLTESNDYLKGVPHASDAFASALWALDYLHWWAARGCSGVNFHNTEWLKTDTVYIDSSGNYHANPKAYAIRMFDLGSRGCVEPVTVANPNGLNLTAYAVGNQRHLYVTIINKEHGGGAHAATVTIVPQGFPPAHAAVMFLTAPHNDAGAMSGITLGGAPITNHAPWRGKWTPLKPHQAGHWVVDVSPTSAAVVEISAQ